VLCCEVVCGEIEDMGNWGKIEDIVLGSELAKLELENVGIEPAKIEDIVRCGIGVGDCRNCGWLNRDCDDGASEDIVLRVFGPKELGLRLCGEIEGDVVLDAGVEIECGIGAELGKEDIVRERWLC